jgi:hypothetical protein
MATVQNIADTSLQKVREAQAKFEEQKKKVEAAKAKAEAATKRAKEVQQRLKELQAVYKATGSVKGGISAIIASQVGNVRAALVVQVQKTVLNMLNKFASECPNQRELQKILKTRNTLLGHVEGLRSRVQKFDSVATSLETTTTTVKVLIKVITSIPLPTAIIPPGGGVGVPVSLLTKYSNTLIKLNKTLDKLIDESAAIKGVVSSIKGPLQTTEDRLKAIDIVIQDCSTGKQLADLSAIVNAAQPRENTGSEGTPDGRYLYKGYELAILQDKDAPKIAPRRYAVAKDKRGIIMLKGQPSFSSSVDILLDEIKFRIDQLV